jgi:20S proteasome subunit alpha 7
MAGTGAGYDLSVTTFSPDGRVFQVEYAQKAVDTSSTTMAICCKDGVIFGVEKFLVSKMLVSGTNKKTFPITRNTGVASSGLVADARQIVLRGRAEAQNYKNAYAEDMPPNLLAERLGMFMHMYTLYGSVRPFGCSVLLGHVDPTTKEPSLFSLEPSGLVFKYQGNAIGKHRQAAKTEIEKLLNSKPDITCEEALLHVAKIIHKVHDEKDRDFELECAWMCPASDYKFCSVPKDKLKAAEEEAKKQLEAEEED